MDLLEYQAKDLFRQMGIPVLPSQQIAQPRDLKGLKIPYPVVLKSQVYKGGRGKVGGIKFVENTIDAVAAAQAIFRLPIMGAYPEVLLAETKYDADREFYLAIVLDTSTRRPLLLGSQYGGVDVEAKLEHMQQVIVDQEFSLFYARRLAIKMGLTGELLEAVSAIIAKMYSLFVQQDLNLIEINPLAIGADGHLMALDGKVVIDDAALGRHADLAALVATTPQPVENPREVYSEQLKRVQLNGHIGVLCNGAGLTMATLDLIQSAKGKSACFVDLGGEYRHPCPPSTLQERLEQGLDLILQDKSVRVILINLLGSIISNPQVAEVIASYLSRRNRNWRLPPMVVRLVGDRLEEASALLAQANVPVVPSLDDAIAKCVILAQAKSA
ncbi:MAG: succinate--CoA ligase subunit beta [Oculatellaceae cyanobacterium Prado106]|jgi:succinyl-CoA synthetase beta subunit|nr:succinate--CoA ligase subunit beta [Oculatellaceae cyanobacterium Prado106]